MCNRGFSSPTSLQSHVALHFERFAAFIFSHAKGASNDEDRLDSNAANSGRDSRRADFTSLHVSNSSGDRAGQEAWLVTPDAKADFDSMFEDIDKNCIRFISGQAVEVFGNFTLPKHVLAKIWDLSDINSEGHLNKDEFAVAMYLIRQQLESKDGLGNLPSTFPVALIPPSMRKQQVPPPSDAISVLTRRGHLQSRARTTSLGRECLSGFGKYSIP